MLYLITGKADAGKTHYAKELCNELKERNELVVWIDGDVFRAKNKNRDYSDAGRIANLREAALAGQEYDKMGYHVVMSFIAPRKLWRDMIRDYYKASVVVYIPGGTLWEGTAYEMPTVEECSLIRKE